MKIFNIIDSLEMNGGSTMFLEMSAAMMKYWKDDEILSFVVSKTGKFGREGLVSSELPASYGVDLGVYDYDSFQPAANKLRDAVIFHHVLGYTKPIRFHNSCRYVVINHARTNVHRLPNFRPFAGLVSVCDFFSVYIRRMAHISSNVILNRIEDYYDESSRKKEGGPFVIGRCQRVVPSKFKRIKVNPKDFQSGYKKLIIGPVSSRRILSEDDTSLGVIFNRTEKIDQIRNFDVYLHNAPSPEGASMAILEALSCGVPVIVNDIPGGVRELVKKGVNGYFFKSRIHLNAILKELQNPKKMKALRKSVRADFLNRLHIKRSLKQYRKFFC